MITNMVAALLGSAQRAEPEGLVDLLLISVFAFSLLTLAVSVVAAGRSLSSRRRAIKAANKALESVTRYETRLLELRSRVEVDPVTRSSDAVARLREELAEATTKRAAGSEWDVSQRARAMNEAVHRGAISTQDARFLDDYVAMEAPTTGPIAVMSGKRALAHA